MITFIGNKFASKSIDDYHNVGHGKAEYVFSLLISVSMIYVALKLAINACKSFFITNEFHYSIGLVLIAGLAILIKSLLFLYTRSYYKKTENVLIKANMLDHRNDIILTSCTLLSAVLSKYNILWVDSFVGFVIAIWIFYSGLMIFLESYDVLMDTAISEEERKKVLKIIDKYPEIKKIQHFNSTPVGYKYQISLTIFVDGNISTFESHQIADKLEKEICKKVDDVYLAIIHVNPI